MGMEMKYILCTECGGIQEAPVGGEICGYCTKARIETNRLLALELNLLELVDAITGAKERGRTGVVPTTTLRISNAMAIIKDLTSTSA